ncbi:MAG: ABC transporter ATP-binding protein [Actinomycetota bacterium]|nr:ABC transporter ATP-binding protein [Actinomycetota bacterium]
MTTEPISLRVDALTKRFGGVSAVREVTFAHASGGVIGLIGPNGAGKTTVFNMMSGAVAPTSGRLELDGRDVTGLRPDRMNRAGVSRTFQNLQVFGSLTVLENVLVAREQFVRSGALRAMLGLGRRGFEQEHSARALELLEMVRVDEHADTLATSLPYGLQRRVEIARALASEPRLLLLDEPLAGLSRAESADLTTLMQQVAGTGVTVLLVEHDVASVMEVSDRVLVLDVGELLADGTAEQVQRDERVRAAYLGESLDGEESA